MLVERNQRGLTTIADVISSDHGVPLTDFGPLLNRLVGKRHDDPDRQSPAGDRLAIAEKDKLNADLDRKIAERTEQLASKAEQLERLSVTDALTSLYNRRYLNAQLTDEWQRS